MLRATFIDTWWTFVIPTICLFSLITNTINMIILTKLKKHNIIYRFLYSKSFVNAVYLFCCFFVFLFKCGPYCKTLKDSFIVKLYQLYIFNYFTSCLGLFSLFVEILISLCRFFTITRIDCLRKLNTNLIVFFFLFISFLFYVPNLILFKTSKINNNVSSTEKYTIEFRSNNTIVFAQILDAINVSVRGFLIVLLIVAINFLSFYKFKYNLSRLYVYNQQKKPILNGNLVLSYIPVYVLYKLSLLNKK
jgi:hypothetical protein